MKTKIKLDSFLSKLPAELQESVSAAVKGDTKNHYVRRMASVNEFKSADDQVAEGYASTRTLDRDNEIVMPDGVDLSQFKKAPVLLWGHNWNEPPIGGDDDIVSDGFGLKAKMKFANTDRAKEIWSLVKDGFLKTSSIGFIPIDWVYADERGFGEIIDGLKAKWPELTNDIVDKIERIFTKSILLEHSIVPVPSNIDSLVTAIVGKALNISEETVERLSLTIPEKKDEEEDKKEVKAFTHNSNVDDNEPDWAAVDKSFLPYLSFVWQAPGTDDNLKSTWKYPHHWVKGGTERDDHDIWSNGTLYLHRQGLNVAWAAAHGARSGEMAPPAVIAHLEEHRRALGIEEEPKHFINPVIRLIRRAEDQDQQIRKIAEEEILRAKGRVL